MRAIATFDPSTRDDPPPEQVTLRNVLVVDDSRAQLRLTARMLSGWGYTTFEAGSAGQALEILAQEEIDLILSDWVMPGMSGLDLARIFRAGHDDRHAYFILLTSKASHSDIAEGLEAGADDFLSKPINAEELRARIAAGERLVSAQRALEGKAAALGEALRELQTVYDGIARDLVEARNLQQSLVPDETRAYPGSRVSFLFEPCGHVGGDLVGAFALREGDTCIYSIDVSGHGIASALLTARLASYLSGIQRMQNIALDRSDPERFRLRPPADVCADLNEMILSDMETELYFTMAIAMYEPSTGTVRYTQAGHPHPVVLRRDGRTETVGQGGLPIGLIDGATFESLTLRLEPGDRLIFYSDGFSEQTGREGAMLGEEGLAGIVRAQRDKRTDPFLAALLDDLRDHANGDSFGDDISAVVLDCEPLASDDVA